MTLHRLLYISEAELDGRETFHAAAASIAGEAGRRNASADLTGVLLHIRGSFIQVLEGPLAAVETVFERICCDFRHRKLRVVEMAPTEERLFAEWSMACLAQNEEPTRLRINRDLEEIYFTVNINAASALRQMRDVLEAEGLWSAAQQHPGDFCSGPAGVCQEKVRLTGCAAEKSWSSRLGATGKASRLSVVPLDRRFWRARKPFSRIPSRIKSMFLRLVARQC